MSLFLDIKNWINLWALRVTYQYRRQEPTSWQLERTYSFSANCLWGGWKHQTKWSKGRTWWNMQMIKDEHDDDDDDDDDDEAGTRSRRSGRSRVGLRRLWGWGFYEVYLAEHDALLQFSLPNASLHRFVAGLYPQRKLESDWWNGSISVSIWELILAEYVNSRQLRSFDVPMMAFSWNPSLRSLQRVYKQMFRMDS